MWMTPRWLSGVLSYQVASLRASLSLLKQRWTMLGRASVAINRTSKCAVTQLVEKADRRKAWGAPGARAGRLPYRIHTIVTDNDIQFTEQPRNGNPAFSRQMRFDMICEANDIEHRLNKPNHPWTNGQSPPPRRRGSSA